MSEYEFMKLVYQYMTLHGNKELVVAVNEVSADIVMARKIKRDLENMGDQISEAKKEWDAQKTK